MRTKSGDKHADILKAAVKVFAEDGFAEAKVATIARVAGVATGSVYNYFDSKEDLLHSIFHRMWTHLLADLSELARDTSLSGEDRFTRMVDSVFDHFSSDANLSRVFVNEQSFWMHRWEGDLATLYHEFMRLLGETLKDAGLKPGLKPEIVRYLFFGAVRQLIHLWADPACPFSREEAREQVVLMLKALSA
jgi:AcrR family transcriptional regulator